MNTFTHHKECLYSFTNHLNRVEKVFFVQITQTDCVKRGQKKKTTTTHNLYSCTCRIVFRFLRYTNSFTKKLRQFNCLFVQFQDIILLVFSIHSFIQRYIRWSDKKYEGNVEVPYIHTKVYTMVSQKIRRQESS